MTDCGGVYKTPYQIASSPVICTGNILGSQVTKIYFQGINNELWVANADRTTGFIGGNYKGKKTSTAPFVDENLSIYLTDPSDDIIWSINALGDETR